MEKEMFLKCERLDQFGRGIAFFDGKVNFVYNFFPGDEGYVRILDSKKNYNLCEIIRLTKNSSFRIVSKCPYDFCGCSLKCLNYDKTLEYKKLKVLDNLKRFCGIEKVDVKIVKSSNIYNYRNKVSLKVRDGKIGFFKNKTNDLIEIDKCMIASFKINEIIKLLKKEDLSLISEIVIKDMNGIMLIIDGVLDISNIKSYVSSIYMSGNLVYGDNFISNNILGMNFLVSKDSFFQVNDSVTEKLYSKVLEYAGEGNMAIDLYCGTGTISLLLCRSFKKVYGIEINKEAVKCANENKKINNITNVSFKCGDANKLVRGLYCDVLVVDPARSGLKKDGIKNILDIKPEKIVYVSCNSVTLSRDLKEFSDLYKISDITLFDMFPWTYHVETVTLLERK